MRLKGYFQSTVPPKPGLRLALAFFDFHEYRGHLLVVLHLIYRHCRLGLQVEAGFRSPQEQPKDRVIDILWAGSSTTNTATTTTTTTTNISTFHSIFQCAENRAILYFTERFGYFLRIQLTYHIRARVRVRARVSKPLIRFWWVES
jgi:hypothetical protein